MKAVNRGSSITTGKLLALILLQIAVLAVAVHNAVAEPISATVQAAHFAEPLIRTAPTTAEEDRALESAVIVYERRRDPEDFSSLTQFLTSYPQSGWAPALLTNLGISYLHEGYFSRALGAWEQAWRLGRDATEPRARALVDGAVGHLAELEASLGQQDRLAVLLNDVRRRGISGSATEAIQAAAEELSLAQKDPRHLFLCGPLALRALLLSIGFDHKQADALRWYRAGPNGTSLAELAGLADKAKFHYRLIFRKPGQPVPLHAIVHWKVGHFAAIIGEENGRYHVKDAVMPDQSLWVTPAALDQEASGYFLVPADAPAAQEWRSVDRAEAGRVWGRGPTNQTQPGDADDPVADDQGADPDGSAPVPAPDTGPDAPPPCAGPPCTCGGMCGYNIKEATVGLTLSDQPVGYDPPLGPSTKIRITYNQREDSQPAVFNFFNVSPKWTVNWLSYITDDPTNAGASVSRYLPGGGAYYYSGYNSSTGTFASETGNGSVLVRTAGPPTTYQRQRRDGGVETYAQSDGSISFPRHIFLTQVTDPQGNSVTLNYDAQLRLTSLTDAAGRQTTFTYGLTGSPLLVTQITDPFGRSANLTYDGSGRLNSITDVIGLTSSFTYDANSLVNSMTTPYGTTSFSYTAPGTSGPPRFLDVQDPLGFHEREEWLEPAPIPDSDPATTVPQGMSTTNVYLTYRDSFHWDKNAYVVAGCTPTGGCDYTKARDRHFLHVAGTTTKSTMIESVKHPLENRIWYNYPGQSSSIDTGSGANPTYIGRVLDDGTTQLRRRSYDTSGYFNLTQTIDPVGRTTSFAYAANAIDLTTVKQTIAGTPTAIAQFAYAPATGCTVAHRACSSTDAAGQITTYTYNAAGQVLTVTNPLSQTTTFAYDGTGRLSSITNANSMTQASFTYDAYDRVRTYTDSEGWVLTYDYDAADRVTRKTYPDGTTDQYAYDKLDLASHLDRLNRLTTYAHDADRRLTQTTDPLGQQTQFAYNPAGKLTTLIDPKGNATNWAYDVQNRTILKRYADFTGITYFYENTTNRLKTLLDPEGQQKQYGYAADNRLTGISYLFPVNPTPNVSFAYDPYFPRRTAMVDGTGTTTYSYVPVGSNGALQLQQEQSPLASSAISYSYDVLGRLSSHTVAGAGAENFGYDAIGRLTSHSNDLGSFSLGYLGQTRQIASRALASSTLQTNWGYLSNTGDRRLASIGNTGLTAGQYSNFAFTSMPENLISGTTQASDVSAAYPTTGNQTGSFNNINQLTDLSGQALSWDPNGNLLSDGTRNYTWDAENRLTGITYPGSPGKATAFSYDGFGRRTAISSTPSGGGSPTVTSHLWCSSRICQARNAGNTTTREYLAEGEYLPGSPAQTYYYGIDQIGSVRRVFATTSSAPAYDYDPYGNLTSAASRFSDFGFAGLLYSSDSGLLLAEYRAYDPVVGRWLSRDRVGESGDPAANLYRYVINNPTTFTDTAGLIVLVPGAGDALADLFRRLFPPSPQFCPVPPGPFPFPGMQSAPPFGKNEPEPAGDLTPDEQAAIQDAVNKAGRPIEVVGSAARGERTAGSDIDYIAPPSSIPYFDQDELPGIDPKTGIIPGYGNPYQGPVIRFEPRY